MGGRSGFDSWPNDRAQDFFESALILLQGASETSLIPLGPAKSLLEDGFILVWESWAGRMGHFNGVCDHSEGGRLPFSDGDMLGCMSCCYQVVFSSCSSFQTRKGIHRKLNCDRLERPTKIA